MVSGIFLYFVSAIWIVAPIDSNGVGTQHSIDIAMDSLDRRYVVYAYYNDIRLAHLEGGEWVIEVVDDDHVSVGKSSLALDSLDRPHIVFQGSGSPPPGNTHYVVHGVKMEGQWFYDTVDIYGSGTTQIVFDSKGWPHVMYFGHPIPEPGGKIVYVPWNGSDWEPYPYWLGGGWFSPALDSLDRPCVAHFTPVTDDLLYSVMSDSFDGWITDTVDWQGYVGTDVSLALDRWDRPHISYFDYSHRDLKYAYWDGNQWIIERVDSIGSTGYCTSIAMDEEGRPYISYYDWAESLVRLAYRDGEQWRIEAVAPVDFSPIYTFSTSLTLDTESRPRIAYTDNALGVSVWYAYRTEPVEIQEPLLLSLQSLNFKVYPNPVRNLLYLEAQYDLPEKTPWFIYDVQGRLPGSGTLRRSRRTLNLNNLSLKRGVYFLNLLGKTHPFVFEP